MVRTPRRSTLLAAAQYALAGLALAWVLSQVRLGTALALFGDVDPPTVAALLAVTGVGLVGRFYTWQVVIRGVRPVSLRAAAAVDLVVNFVNQLLPSRLTGRLAAPFVLRGRTGMTYADAAAVSGVHTGVYAVCYGLTAAAGLVLAAPRLSVGVVVLLALSTALYLAAGTVVLVGGANLPAVDRLLSPLLRPLGRLPRIGPYLLDRAEGTPAFAAASAGTVGRLAGAPGVWARYAVGWTVALVFAPGLRVLLLFGAFGVSLEPALAVPLYLVAAYSVTLLPLTPGGIGVTEATATVVFVELGVPSAVVVAVIFADRLLGVYLPAVAGWYPSLGIDVAELSAGE